MVEINLLPWRAELKTQEKNKQSFELIFAVLLALLLLLSFHFILLSHVQALKTRVLQLEQGLVKVNQGLEEVRNLYQQLDYQQLPEVDLNLILSRQRQILDFLQKLASLMPERVYLSQIHFDEQAWVIDGVSQIPADLLLFTERLKKNLKNGGQDGSLKKEKFLNIKQENGLFYFQLRFEGGL